MDDKQRTARMESSIRHHDKQMKRYAQNYVESLTIEQLNYSDTDMLVFIDESGDVVRSRTCNHFCMGGISLWGRDYRDLEIEWRHLKMEMLGLRPHELFHTTENLKQLDDKGKWGLERFLAGSKFNVVLGQAILDEMYGPKVQPFLTSTSPLGVIESQINQIYGYQKRDEHWVIEKSGKQDWRMMQMKLGGESYHHFPKGEHGQLSFVNKRRTVLCGLEIADLIMNLFYKLNPEYSNTVIQWRNSGEMIPPYSLRLYQAAIGIPFAPLFTPWRESAFGLAF